MKKCPQCGREYDGSMMFCLDDGAELLYGPAAPHLPEEGWPQAGVVGADGPATAILHSTDAAAEAGTKAQIFTTDRTALLSSDTVPTAPTKGFHRRLLLAPVALAVKIGRASCRERV